MKTSLNKTANQNVDEEAATGEDERGDLLIRGFWAAGADVCVTDAAGCEVPLQRDPIQSAGVARKREETKTPWGMPC
jgi:hypothetical protein